MIRVWVILLILWPGVIWAFTLPELHDVTGVAPNDVLNVRAAPNALSEKVSELAHDVANVEVVDRSPDGKWGLVNSGEASGWVSLRYLAPHAENPDFSIGRKLTCSGTEPLWSLEIEQGKQARFDGLGLQAVSMTADVMQQARGRIDRFSLTVGLSGVAMVRAQQCSDGMSERAYGLDVDYLHHDGVLYSGCCSVIAH
ncbi:COG3650 family protein [Tropicibacter sp. Alg240-R139]|uniref:COG3650 family protein n=1 Tax=Tropicibacter sp. Alg240-R139 TaxID=2305991 RepID=UPI0013DEA875|nr:SH3 domain-containing protein [Tropicibacter sp. Alg240-R139]